MNRTEINLESAAAWPLTKERLAEMARDNESLQTMVGAWAMEVGAKEAHPVLPEQNCVIVAGCRRRGESGWALWNGELCEVMSSNDEREDCLRPVERRVTVTAGGSGAVYEVETGTPEELEEDEGDLTQQTVRVERRLEWYNSGGNKSAVYWAGCRRLLVRAVPADMGDEWEELPSGWAWSTSQEGQHTWRAQMAGGRVHLSGDVTVGLREPNGPLVPVVAEPGTIYTGMPKLCEVYGKYEPAGDVLVPVLVNGTVVPGVIHGGCLMTGRSLTLGDRVAVDTYYDL